MNIADKKELTLVSLKDLKELDEAITEGCPHRISEAWLKIKRTLKF